jgi:peptidoglycan/LPS O-acetylase OafA/YrhL
MPLNNIKYSSFIPSLTGIRCICVYLIFFKHFNPFNKTESPIEFLLFNQFYIFLSFFFVLSGFVICYKYFFDAQLNRSYLIPFFKNRIARVFPLLFTLTTITFLIYLKNGRDIKEVYTEYLLNITLLKGFSSNYFLTGIGPSWSLSIEELFYLVAPLMFYFIKKGYRLHIILSSFYIIGIFLVLFFSIFPFHGFFSNLKFSFYSTFFGRCFEFICGFWLAFVIKKYKNYQKLNMTSNTIALFAFLILFFVLAAEYFIAYFFQLEHGIDHWLGLLINNILLPIGITILFYHLILYKSWLRNFLEKKYIVYLGQATYSFYLIHTCFLQDIIRKYISNNIYIILIFMVVFSVLSFRYFEEPASRFLRNAKTYK